MRVSRLAASILKRIPGTRRTLQQIATRSWTIHPPQSQATPPAIYIEDDLSRVTGVQEHTTLPLELRKIRGCTAEHFATTAHEVRDVELLQGVLVKGAFTMPAAPRSRRLLSPDPPPIDQPCALSSTYFGGVYFGHWMTDDLSLQLTAESLGEAVAVDRKPYGHEPGYYQLLDISRQSIPAARFSQLIVVEDMGQNPDKQRRYQELRGRMRRHADPEPGRRVYIRRGVSGALAARRLVNAGEVEALLASQGFSIIDPDTLSAQQIAAGLAGARLIVGVEGSHMLHAMYTMADDARLCIMQPPYRFYNVIKSYADALNMRYGFTVGDAHPEGFTIRTANLMEVLGRLDSAAPLP